MSTRPTTPTPAPSGDDLQALMAEIIATTGVSAETALQLAMIQRVALRQYACQWDAMVQRLRAAIASPPSTPDADDPANPADPTPA
ncbi:hypothetical protein [Candidatus Chloroploca sp. Khr17]|uniref:hypothetical protein n=1 Tax=Candidatus Chloroploca sp. Khr17 TaxID=2496869 RepID=UPI00101BD662|nr:hypothetical protein [Candidatus Chloroploca sp. Khr17]